MSDEERTKLRKETKEEFEKRNKENPWVEYSSVCRCGKRSKPPERWCSECGQETVLIKATEKWLG